MAKVYNYYEMKLRRFSKEMVEIVDKIVKIEKKWTLGATTVEEARTDLLMVGELIKTLTDKALELNVLDDKYDLVKFRLDNSRAKIRKALRGDWGE